MPVDDGAGERDMNIGASMPAVVPAIEMVPVVDDGGDPCVAPGPRPRVPAIGERRNALLGQPLQ